MFETLPPAAIGLAPARISPAFIGTPKKRLSKGALAGIITAAAILAVIILVTALFVYARKKKGKTLTLALARAA